MHSIRHVIRLLSVLSFSRRLIRDYCGLHPLHMAVDLILTEACIVARSVAVIIESELHAYRMNLDK